MTPQNHRDMNTLLIIIIGFSIIITIFITKHNMHDCEERLFEKLTKMKAPTEKQLKE